VFIWYQYISDVVMWSFYLFAVLLLWRRCLQLSSNLQASIDMNSLYLPRLMSTKLTNFKDTPDKVVLALLVVFSYSSSPCFDHLNSKLDIVFANW